jgi:hypothetical protein
MFMSAIVCLGWGVFVPLLTGILVRPEKEALQALKQGGPLGLLTAVSYLALGASSICGSAILVLEITDLYEL